MNTPSDTYLFYIIERYRVLSKFYGAERALGFFNLDERSAILRAVCTNVQR